MPVFVGNAMCLFGMYLSVFATTYVSASICCVAAVLLEVGAEREESWSLFVTLPGGHHHYLH